MAWCKAFVPIAGSPPYRPDPHASSRRAHTRTRAVPDRPAFLHKRFPPAHTRTRPSHCKPHFCTNEFDPCTPEPDHRPRRPKRTNEPTFCPSQPKAPAHVTPSQPLAPPPSAAPQPRPLPSVRPRCARAPVPARPLLHRPAVCPKTVTAPSTPPSTTPPVHEMLQGFRSYQRAPAMPPGPALILPPHARANPSRARPPGVFCTNDVRARTREPGPAAAQRLSAQANSIVARPNPRPRGRHALPTSALQPPSAAPQPRPSCPSALAPLGLPSRRGTCSTVRQSA